MLDQCIRLLTSTPLSDVESTKAIDAIDEFLAFECNLDLTNVRPPVDYFQRVRDLRSSLAPEGIHGRVVCAVARSPWGRRNLSIDAEWRSECAQLAGELLSSPAVFATELDWLMSPDAQSAELFGREIGLLDSDLMMLSVIFEAAVSYQSTALARGYLIGHIENGCHLIDRVNGFLDEIEVKSTHVGFDLWIVGGSRTHALDRTLRQITSGILKPSTLRAFMYGLDGQPLSNEVFSELFTRLCTFSEAGDDGASDVALDYIGFKVSGGEDAVRPIMSYEPTRNAVIGLLSRTMAHPNSEHWWAKILLSVTPFEPRTSATLAIHALVSDRVQMRHALAEVLNLLASSYPNELLDAITPLLEDDSEYRWRLMIGEYKQMVSAIPSNVLKDWLRRAGKQAARFIASNIPIPFIDADGVPAVAPATEYVLTEFEGSDDVFRSFLVGTHRLQMYSGDIARQHEHEADVARKFLNHPLRRIREWAVIEEKRSREWAAKERERSEEEDMR